MTAHETTPSASDLSAWSHSELASLMGLAAKNDHREMIDLLLAELERRGETAREIEQGRGAVAGLPWQECYSIDGDSWCDSPDDAGFISGLSVGDEFELLVSHYSVNRRYRITKAPDENSDEYTIESLPPHGESR